MGRMRRRAVHSNSLFSYLILLVSSYFRCWRQQAAFSPPFICLREQDNCKAVSNSRTGRLYTNQRNVDYILIQVMNNCIRVEVGIRLMHLLAVCTCGRGVHFTQCPALQFIWCTFGHLQSLVNVAAVVLNGRLNGKLKCREALSQNSFQLSDRLSLNASPLLVVSASYDRVGLSEQCRPEQIGFVNVVGYCWTALPVSVQHSQVYAQSVILNWIVIGQV